MHNIELSAYYAWWCGLGTMGSEKAKLFAAAAVFFGQLAEAVLPDERPGKL